MFCWLEVTSENTATTRRCDELLELLEMLMEASESVELAQDNITHKAVPNVAYWWQFIHQYVVTELPVAVFACTSFKKH